MRTRKCRVKIDAQWDEYSLYKIAHWSKNLFMKIKLFLIDPPLSNDDKHDVICDLSDLTIFIDFSVASQCDKKV